MVKTPEKTEEGIAACRERLKQAVASLNLWARLDPLALNTIVNIHVPCSSRLEVTPMDVSMSVRSYQINGLSLVNGFFAFTYEHEGRIRYAYIRPEGNPVQHFIIADEEVHEQPNTISIDSNQDLSGSDKGSAESD